MTRLVYALVTSKLDSCNDVLTGLPGKEINKLQHVQNAAARLVAGAKKQEHITPVLQTLHWLPIRARIDFKILLITYKALRSFHRFAVGSSFAHEGKIIIFERYQCSLTKTIQLN